MSQELINPFKMPQIKITPMQDGISLLWQCKCMAMNELLKKDLTENHAYFCGNCGHCWMLGTIPDDMRHWLKDDNPIKNVNVRPRITRN